MKIVYRNDALQNWRRTTLKKKWTVKYFSQISGVFMPGTHDHDGNWSLSWSGYDAFPLRSSKKRQLSVRDIWNPSNLRLIKRGLQIPYSFQLLMLQNATFLLKKKKSKKFSDDLGSTTHALPLWTLSMLVTSGFLWKGFLTTRTWFLGAVFNSHNFIHSSQFPSKYICIYFLDLLCEDTYASTWRYSILPICFNVSHKQLRACHFCNNRPDSWHAGKVFRARALKLAIRDWRSFCDSSFHQVSCSFLIISSTKYT